MTLPEEIKTKVMSSAIGALVMGVLSGIFGILPVYNKLSETSAESGDRLGKLQMKEKELENLLREKLDRESAFYSLKRDYENLQEDYHRAISSEGITLESSLLDEDFQTSQVRTGGRIRFKLTSSSCYFNIVRITNEGPIIRFTGPKPLVVGTAQMSQQDGQYAYLLPKGIELHLQVSTTGSEEGYLSADLSDMEDIVLACTDFDVKTQQLVLKYRKWLSWR